MISKQSRQAEMGFDGISRLSRLFPIFRAVRSPVAVIAEDGHGGQLADTYGKDPYLASAIAHMIVAKFENKWMVTPPTHFAPNVAEGGCESNPTGVTEHTLQERYFPPFDAAIEDDGALSVMPAYDLVDESPATQNRRSLIGILRTL